MIQYNTIMQIFFESLMMQFDNILQTCWNLFNKNMMKYLKWIPRIAFDKRAVKNMSRLVEIVWYDLIRFYKHVQTCHDTIWYDSTNMYRLVMIRFDTILQTCINLSKTKTWQNTPKYTKFWANRKQEVDDCKVIPWTAMLQTFPK